MSDEKTNNRIKKEKIITDLHRNISKIDPHIFMNAGKVAKFTESIPNLDLLSGEYSKKMKSLKNIMAPIKQVIPEMFSSPKTLEAFKRAHEFAKIIETANNNHFLVKQTTETLWNDFEKELKNTNRYFPKSAFVTVFTEYSKEAKCILHKGMTLYRARKIKMEEISSKSVAVLNAATDDYNNDTRRMRFSENEGVYEYIQHIDQDRWQEEYINKFSLQDVAFWGFGAKDSDAPPENTSSQGRINPIGISYLYTADDAKTAVSEIQPTIGQMISIAKIKTTKELNIFDFSFYKTFENSEIMHCPISEFKKRFGISFWDLQTFFDTLSGLFSKPALEKNESYFATQYISELIKHLGFDGIRYKSALISSGFNIVLFDVSKDINDEPLNYRILSSSLHRIKNVKVTEEKILPRKNTRKLE